MGKLWIPFVIILLCVTSSYAATLIDSENFQSYTDFGSGGNQTTFFNQAAGKWNCTTAGEYPYCTGCAADGCAGISNFSIKSNSLDNYMSIWALGIVYAAPKYYYDVDLHWNMTHSVNFSQYNQSMDFLFNYNLKLVSADLTAGGGGNTYFSHFALDYARQISSVPEFLTFSLGGTNLAGNDSMFRRFHSDRQTGFAANWAQPATPPATCDIDDGQWHSITSIYRVNATHTLINWSTLIDGVVCNTTAGNLQSYTPSEQFFPNPLRVWARGGFWVNLDNLSIWEANATENFTGAPLSLYDCSDSIDNDGDGFIDYPADTSCTSPTGTTELPFTYTQCNNAIDDDGEGLIDLADPCCFGNPTTASESCYLDPSRQNDTVCLPDMQCVMHTEFPYTENITLHGWYGDLARFKIESLAHYGLESEYMIYFDNTKPVGYLSFNISKNITNPNVYDDLEIDYELVFDANATLGGSYSFYITFYDSVGKKVVRIQYSVQDYDATHLIVYEDYQHQNGSFENIGQNIIEKGNVFEIDIKATILLNQIEKSFAISFDYNQVTFVAGRFNYTDQTAGNVNSINVENFNLDSRNILVMLDNIYLVGGLPSTFTQCTPYDLPYFLKEDFNGDITLCGWSSTNSINFLNMMTINAGRGYYSAEKDVVSPIDGTSLDGINTRYGTISFNLNLKNVNGSNWEIRLYDGSLNNFFVLYSYGDNLFYNENGHGTTFLSSVPLNTPSQIMLVFDFQSDTFDGYYNGTQVVSGGKFITDFYNLQNIRHLKISSTNVGFDLSNLAVYSSDSAGNPLLPNAGTVISINNQTSMCGLVFLTQPSCHVDSDCTSGDCLPTHYCNTFNMNYCDENSMTRGNSCMFKAYSSCAFTSTAGWVFDNFLWVLIAMLILMGWVYISVMARRVK